MIDPRNITPLLNNMTVGKKIGQGPNGETYLVTNRMDGKKLTLKHISIPLSDSQTKALIYAGAVADEREAQKYYATTVKELKGELLLLNSIQNSGNLQKFRGYQIDQKFTGAGFDVYLISDYNKSLPTILKEGNITKLQAVNLGIDLCSALEQLRSAELIHKDVRPENVFMDENNRFLLGDLGIVPLADLKYSTMPDNLITDYSAPEVRSTDSTLSPSMDIYAVGMILYHVFHGDKAPVRKADVELAAPQYADMALTEIILKACSYDANQRYQSPSDMKQALVLYMQRANVTDERLYPASAVAVPPAKDETEVDFAAIAATIEAAQKQDKAEDQSAETEDATKIVPTVTEDATSEEAPAVEIPEEAPAAPVEEVPVIEIESADAQKTTLADLKDDDLLIPTTGETTVAAFLAAMKNAPGFEVMSMDGEGNLEAVPGYENVDDLPEDTKIVDSADNQAVPQLSIEDAAATADAISAAIAEVTGEKAENKMQEEPKREDPMISSPALNLNTEDPRLPREPRRVHRKEDINSYDAEEEEIQEEKEGMPTWKKVLITLIVLLVLAGSVTGLYFFKTDTISNMQSQVLSSTSIQVTADTKYGSGMDVVCSTAAGEVSRLPYAEGGVTFTDLSPNTTYSFEMESTAKKLLLGGKTSSGKTNQMTNLTSFSATEISAISATIALSGTGPTPENWVVTLTPDAGEAIVVESPNTEIFVEGLTPATNYYVSIAKSDGDILGGTTTCSFQTMGYTTLNSFGTVDVTTTSTTIEWFYEGTVPDNWTITCIGDDGTETTQDVAGSETSCTLDGLTSGVTYTITIDCPSIFPTELSTISVGIPSVTITDMSYDQGENDEIIVSWEYTGDITPESWSISYEYISNEAVTPTLISSDENSVTLTGLVPKSDYIIKVVEADGFTVGGGTEITVSTKGAKEFDGYGVKDVSISLQLAGGDGTKVTSFTTTDLMKFAIQASYEVTEENKEVATTYVIRDSEGKPAFVYNGSKNWSGTWTTVEHKGEIPDMPQRAGEYSFEVYFDGALIAETDFSVSASE